MDILSSHIAIGSITYDFVNQVEIESTSEELTQKGTIVLPANVKVDKSKLKDIIKRGDKTVIKLGLNGDLKEVFTGFVSRVKPTTPIEIQVEDLMWKLKQLIVNDTAKNETIQSFLSRVAPDIEFDCYDIELPRFLASKISVAQLLDQIKSDYGLRAFVRNGKVVVGKQYDPENYTVHIAELENNVLSDDLEYMVKDELKIKVRAISNLSSGKKIEVELGDKDGEERTLNFYNIASESELQKIAQKEMERLIYDGYRGSLTFFGEPFVQHGDVIEIRDPKESDKTGRYWVDGVNYSFGVGGYRQTIKLGARA